MKIIRWFLSHLFLILLIVVVIYGYMFWGNLAGENTPAGKALAYLSHEFVEVEEFIIAVKAKQAKLSAGKQPSAPAQIEKKPLVAAASEAASSEPASSKPSKLAPATTNISQQPVSISYSHDQKQITQNSNGDIKVQLKQPVLTIRQGETAENTVASADAASEPETQQAFVSEKIEQQLDNVDKNGNVIDKKLPERNIRDSWITARKSYYQRNYALSEKSYQHVIANTSDNFDAYGELGNVYFNQGKKQQAAAAYFEAATILVRKGQLRRAKSLMGLLKHLDKSKADDLRELIDSVKS